MIESTGIKNYGVEVTFNGMTPVLNAIKIYHLVQTFIRGIDPQTGNYIVSHFFTSGKISRLKVNTKVA
jgi:hypothetical protein